MARLPVSRPRVDPTRPALVLDGDNTLWPCGVYYAQAREEFEALLAPRLPAECRPSILPTFRACELESFERPDGFQRDQFPSAMVRAYERLCAHAGILPRDRLRRACYAIGDQVFHADYTPYPGTMETLTAYRDAGFALAICTKGDPTVQRPLKVDRHGLHTLVDHVAVVPHKPAHAIRAAYEQIRVHAGQPGIMIGDSRRDDIAGGRAAGLGTVLVTKGAPPGWVFEDGYGHIAADHEIGHVVDLPDVIPLAPVRDAARPARVG